MAETAAKDIRIVSEDRLAEPATEREPDAVYLATADQLAMLERVFAWHPPQAGQLERYEALRAQARALAYRLLVWCPESRERSLAMTHLEQSLMWAAAAIARNE
jgi:hypothetical protein